MKLIEATKPSRGNEAFVKCPAHNPCLAPLLDFPRQPSHDIGVMALHRHAHAFVMPSCRHRKKSTCMSWSPCILLPLPSMCPAVPQGQGEVCPWHGHDPTPPPPPPPPPLPPPPPPPPPVKSYLNLFRVFSKRHQPMLNRHNGIIK